jgi:2-amino-4-hydroxy-6-hydroxymethyldihydropteridine diphosphokinase
VTRAFVGLGANLGDREAALGAAIALLEGLDGVRVTAVSEFRETEPVDYLEQPRFLNAAAELETTLAPGELLASLLEVEQALGRTRDGPRFGPRTIDLDLLLVEGIVVEEPGLTVPHPRLHERRFALEPLADLDPQLIVPGHGTVAQLLHQLE